MMAVKRQSCLSEQYTFPFPQDLPLLNFLGHHRKLVGREWLFRELEDSVLKNDNLRGVMFLANIGYGKSAIIRHLLCAGEGEKGYELRQHVKAFHVCKFDIRSTRLPSRFVRRLIGFLATASAEYGSIIEYLGNNSLFYDQSACESDIKACFDLAVTQPLQQITGDMEPVLFAIDALDECYDSNKETNPIMDILQSRLSKLPKWFKVVITARNGTISAWFKQHVLLQNLQFSDSNNTADIKEFISESNITNTAKEALYQSKGNFLYVNKLLENKDSIENYKDLPQSLEEIYEENFSRHFGTTERYFDTAKRILEIVCASMCSLKVPQIMQVLGVNNDSYNSFNEVFEKLFTFCLTETDIGIVFVHQSIYSWVISDRNENYKISVTRGHEMIAKYMLSASYSEKTQINIVKLAMHVESSGNDILKKKFYSLQIENVHHLLHHAIKNTSSVEVLRMVFHHVKHEDHVDSSGATPLFLAAMEGQVEQLRFLVLKGANIFFRYNEISYCQQTLSAALKLTLSIKQSTFWGYGLLHIAARFNSTGVVKFLLQKMTVNHLNLKSATGQTALDIACEYGFYDIVVDLHTSGADLSKCMSYASRGNHLHIVKYLHRQGHTVSCVSLEDGNIALTQLMNLSHCVKSFTGSGFNTFDLWHQVLRYNPLHEAIKFESNDVGLYLVKHFPHLLSCKTSYGLTPFLMTIYYKNFDLIRVMVKGHNSDRCGNMSTYLPEAHEYCPSGGNFAHLIALTGKGDIVRFFISDLNQTKGWDLPDDMGIYPVHYAASKDNYYFLENVNVLALNVSAKTKNGSTAFHLAALHKSRRSFIVLKMHSNSLIINVKDSYDRNCFHYLFLLPNCESTDERDRVHFNIRHFIEVMNNVPVDDTDILGRNIFHYALLNGYHDEFETMKTNMDTNMLLKMLSHADISGMTAVEYMVRNVQRSKVIKKIITLDSVAITIEDAKSFFSKVYGIEPWESTVVGLLYFEKHKFIYPVIKRSLLKWLSTVVCKSPYILHTLLKLYPKLVSRKTLIESIMHGMSLASWNGFERVIPWSIYSLSLHRVDFLLGCEKPLTKSPVNFMLQQFYTNDLQIFQNIVSHEKRSCLDQKGFSMMDYALIGGNIGVARYLLNGGYHLSKNGAISIKERIINTIKESQYSKYYPLAEYEQICSNADQINCTDMFLRKFIAIHRDKLLFTDFCEDKKQTLSLIHTFAINGMYKTNTILFRLFGKKLLECKTSHMFTPLYFSKLFSKDRLTKFLKKLKVKNTLPDTSEETMLVFNLVKRFPFTNVDDPLFCLQFMRRKHVRYNLRHVRKHFDCLNTKMNKSDLVFACTYKPLYWVYAYFIQYVSVLKKIDALYQGYLMNNHKCFSKLTFDRFSKSTIELQSWDAIPQPIISHLKKHRCSRQLVKRINSLPRKQLLNCSKKSPALSVYKNLIENLIVRSLDKLDDIFTYLHITHLLIKYNRLSDRVFTMQRLNIPSHLRRELFLTVYSNRYSMMTSDIFSKTRQFMLQVERTIAYKEIKATGPLITDVDSCMDDMYQILTNEKRRKEKIFQLNHEDKNKVCSLAGYVNEILLRRVS
ncbi:uncharacterized protein LOC128243122 isoform X2 [Mya arenaria]|uniref:uncharacterized protein LOC128243122 isoform X2 n=1 Tax=Mya arenaria TaxID=6604 RepID=UPI0022DEBDF0|nr:uncharacterized protein LOC128243122 isoform X2 [Mya arenaria]